MIDVRAVKGCVAPFRTSRPAQDMTKDDRLPFSASSTSTLGIHSGASFQTVLVELQTRDGWESLD